MRYNVVIRGRVQDIGFRRYITELANLSNIKGYIYNDIDGSVKMIVDGELEVISAFLEEIRTKNEVDSIEKQEISRDFYIPFKFARLETDELADIGRKLDIGVKALIGTEKDISEIKQDTSKIKQDISEIKQDTSKIKQDISEIKQDTSKIKQDISEIKNSVAILPEMKNTLDILVEGQKEIIELLKKIAEK